ncbi:hypothetical protein [Bosea sp. PAMC 26642]|uniref:hypothetical protein n=1 Tax=Bosea sp. (strain PAMC 26642) TaxID=1792307 RepID=UPI0007705E62|nr:hypothetical protein [Bosea sp. PAMC 26642]AMJ60972.1 hypothetical protein AXW83_12280 [Bosea sp. PAMC 26642]
MITTTASRANTSIDALRAMVEPHKESRADDLPFMTVEDIDVRLTSLMHQGAMPAFAAMVRRVGIRRDPSWVSHAVMIAALEAMHHHRARSEWREPALADVKKQVTMLDRAADALAELAHVQKTRGLRCSAVAQTINPHEASDPLLSVDLLRQIEQERDRLLNEAAALDGRCRPMSRARLFADALWPLFLSLTDGVRGHRTGFTDFVRHSCLVVTDHMPSETLIRSVVTKRTK